MKRKNLGFILSIICLISSVCYAGTLTVESDKQEFKDSDKKIYLEGNVKVKTDDVDIASPYAVVEVDANNNKVNKVEFKENAYSYSMKDGKKHEVKAQILEMSLLNKVISAKGNTISTIMDKTKPVVIVTADRQEYHKNNNLMKAIGSVNIIYNNVETFSNEALVYLTNNNDVKKIELIGQAKLKQDKSQIHANKLTYDNIKSQAEAFGSVYTDIITEDNKRLEVWSNYQFYDKNENFVTASGNANIKYEDYNAKGPKVNVYSDKDTNKLNEAVFLGRSTIETKGRTVSADRITITMNPKDFKAEGNVKSVIPNFGT